MRPKQQELLFALPLDTKRRKKLSDDIWQFTMRPSTIIADVMIGKVALEDQPDSIQSACKHEIYNRACRILEIETKLARRAEIGRMPEKLRPHIETEIMRIWKMRNDKS